MHWPDEKTPIEETMAILMFRKKKTIGSNSSKELIPDAERKVKIRFSIVDQSEEN